MINASCSTETAYQSATRIGDRGARAMDSAHRRRRAMRLLGIGIRFACSESPPDRHPEKGRSEMSEFDELVASPGVLMAGPRR
jgi:hypothetical protein